MALRVSTTRCALVFAILLLAAGTSALQASWRVGGRRKFHAFGLRTSVHLRALRGGVETAADEGHAGDIATALKFKDAGVLRWRDSAFTEAAALFQQAAEALPQTDEARPERVKCLNNWAACMIKLDRPKEAADLCTQTLELEPSNKKARLRRGLAFEALQLPAKAAADMVILLGEDAALVQAVDCLRRCLDLSPSLRSDVVGELTAVLARVATEDEDKTAARIAGAQLLAEKAFVEVLGLPPTQEAQDEGPQLTPGAQVASAAAVAGQEEEAAVAAATANSAAAAKAQEESAPPPQAAAETRAQAPASALDPDRPGESLRDAFARRLSASGKDGKTQEQELAQLEWDLQQLQARTDTLNARVPDVIAYASTLPAPGEPSKGAPAAARRKSAAVSQLEVMRLKRLGRWPPAANTVANAPPSPVRAGALGQSDAAEQCMKQLETMLKQCIDYSELGMMIMVRLDGVVERAARAADSAPLLQDAVQGGAEADADGLVARRKKMVRQVQELVALTDQNRELLLKQAEAMRPPVPLQHKVAGAAAKAWRKLLDSGAVKGVLLASVGVAGWRAVATSGGLEMLALCAVHEAMNAADLVGEQARRYQRLWFPSLEQHRESTAMGLQAWEAEEAAYVKAVVLWKRDVRRHERECLKHEIDAGSGPWWQRIASDASRKASSRPPPPPPPRRAVRLPDNMQSNFKGQPPPGMGKLGDEGMRKALS